MSSRGVKVKVPVKGKVNIFGSNFFPDVKFFSYSLTGKTMNYGLI